MGLDIWFAEDIRNALLAANEASAQMAAVIAEVGLAMGPHDGREFFERGEIVSSDEAADLLAISLRAYREGFRAALTTVALAFGIAPQAISPRPFDHAQDRPLEELAGTVKIPAREEQDAALPRSAAAWEP